MGFYHEESEAADRDADKDLALNHQAAGELKKVIDEIHSLKSSKSKQADIDELRIHGTLQFLTMRKLNRLAHFRCKSVRDSTSDAKLKIDQHHLKLQNLLYEAMYLEKEITKCLEFKSKDEEINLVSLEEFHRDAPESISRPSVTKDDPHQLTLARLEFELEQRKRQALCETHKPTEEKKNVLAAEIKTKKEYLESLKPKLQTILQATKPVQEYLGMPFDEVREQHMVASYLPRPLYVLYMQATAYRDACDQHVSACILGDIDVAKSLEGVSQHLDVDDDESDQEDSEKPDQKRRRRDSTKDPLTVKRQKLLTKHPLTVDLTVHCKDGSSLHLSFAYLIYLEIVTVTVRVDPSSEAVKDGISTGDLCSPESLLKCLYPEDLGTETPRASNKYALQKLGMGEFSQYVAELGRPYLWVQWLCGMQVLSVCDDQPTGTPQLSLSEIHMEGTIKRLRQRMKHRLSLHRQLSSLGLSLGRTEWLSLIRTAMRSFLLRLIHVWRHGNDQRARISWRASPFTQELIGQGIGREQDLFFNGTIVNKSAKLDFFCVLPPNYPTVVPLFAIHLIWSSRKGIANADHVRDMAAEVNIHFSELARPRHSEEVLTNQIRRLLMCFDVYLESEFDLESSLGHSEIPKEKTFARTALGPNRAKPFKYNSHLGYFSQR
ncbi:hypothetical protein CAPTEDRAFT_18172 [Capitella teleta]|uniref:THO complex subunit 5 homolog n=1 Tax=Capitella teleta TaxID=283909 RepID=R7U3M2_CAPTE|nr:hypothetical protein CAPTEDRAFT_18172 [Capitella teleta]|eukprot:ELT98266.1 hypothetical protein CAPTEDRAFT_18172 [Capitella teleta]